MLVLMCAFGFWFLVLVCPHSGHAGGFWFVHAVVSHGVFSLSTQWFRMGFLVCPLSFFSSFLLSVHAFVVYVSNWVSSLNLLDLEHSASFP